MVTMVMIMDDDDSYDDDGMVMMILTTTMIIIISKEEEKENFICTIVAAVRCHAVCSTAAVMGTRSFRTSCTIIIVLAI